jgi:CheY-like chemotaxis protein
MAVVQEQVSLIRLSEQLDQELALPPAPPSEILDSADVTEPVTPTAPTPDPRWELPPAPKVRAAVLEGCRVGAIGFGRQDIAGLAGAMLEKRARVEFLPRGEIAGQAGYDLFLLNCASVDILKRDISSFQSVLESGTPTIVIGSRAGLSVLRDSGDPRTWDFASKPLHMDELIWRAASLLERCEETVLRRLPARVVVADGDPFTRTLIESALSQQGFACELVEDGEAAWTAIGRYEPGAVILDLTLPNRDGFQVMADIRRATGRKPKVIVLSARQSEADILRAFALGADDYLTKPFSPLELSARLTRLVGGAPENA